MTKTNSLFIRDDVVSEVQKVELRQGFVCEFSKSSASDLQDIFQTQLPLEQVGKKNCENLVGSVEVPVGFAGPVRAKVTAIDSFGVVSKQVSQEFLVPLATTEGALVASIHRGLKVLSTAQTKVVVRKVGMSRSVVIECSSIDDAVTFTKYFSENSSKFAQYCEETSTHLRFLSYEVFMRDKLLYYRFVFDTDEAMGMNMVTIALSHAWDRFKRELPNTIWVKLLTVSGNVCTDKKDSMINRLRGRGYHVTVESKIPSADVTELLKVEPSALVKTHLVKNVIGSNIAGSFAQNMHVANALAAFYLATGQDIAHVVAGSEASVHFEVLESGELYFALTLPNVSVGSVGGGTWLPKQMQARLALSKNKQVLAKELATVAGLAALAGEVSGLAALSTDTLASAHARLGRAQK